MLWWLSQTRAFNRSACYIVHVVSLRECHVDLNWMQHLPSDCPLSGPAALHGLTRVRRFQQDDAHIFCRPDQVSPPLAASCCTQSTDCSIRHELRDLGVHLRCCFCCGA